MDISKAICPGCGKPMTPVACLCDDCGFRLEGPFTISPLATLPAQDQAIIIAFLRGFGSIKNVQEILGVSFPTARARIERIVSNLNESMEVPGDREKVLERLARGEISFDQALERL